MGTLSYLWLIFYFTESFLWQLSSKLFISRSISHQMVVCSRRDLVCILGLTNFIGHYGCISIITLKDIFHGIIRHTLLESNRL